MTLKRLRGSLRLRRYGIFLSLVVILLCLQARPVDAQNAYPEDTTILLIADQLVQIEITEAVNDMYNFKFAKAEQQFRWLKQKYPTHPLPYFLMGLSEWWKILPNTKNDSYDERFYAFMDTAIYFAEKIYDVPQYKVEGAFFLAGSYGFIGRLRSERKQWRKAASAGSKALKFLKASRGYEEFSVELLFGDALYNYYSVWIPENYPALKPILLFFKKGDKDLGLQQLREVANNAFYTRVEAQYFLMRILSTEDPPNLAAALQLAEYLHQIFPNNSYFHRYYARMLYSSGKFVSAEKVSKEILRNIDSAKMGYGIEDGRYASFFVGEVNFRRRSLNEAKTNYLRAVSYGEEADNLKSGYTLYSLLNLGRIAEMQKDYKGAKTYYKRVRKYGKKKHPADKRAKKYLKDLKKIKKSKS